jgi:uncharacterized membrane protein
MTSVLRGTGWILMTLLAALVAFIASRYFWQPLNEVAPPSLFATLAERQTVFLFHAGGGLIALVTGAWNFLQKSREGFLYLHHWLGRIYLVSVMTSGIAGFSLAFTAQGGLSARIGFGMLAVLWVITGVFAYLRIRTYDIDAHRRWMIRNYALTFAAVTLRLWLPALMISGHDFPTAYTTVAWLCWVPNLLIAELIASHQRGRQVPQRTDRLAAKT